MPPDAVRLHLSVQYATTRVCPQRAQLRRWVSGAVRRALPAAPALREAALLLRFVDEAEGRALNREHRGSDHATNVLTFAYEQGPEISADIVLCTSVVEREAREQRKTVQHHYAHLVVHGVLHACGHDHELVADGERMEAIETEVLAHFGIADPYA